jgi:MFS family permease
VLLGGVALGLIAGLLAGGRFANLAEIRLRWAAVIFLALIVRFGAEIGIDRGVAIVEQLRLPIFAAAFLLLAIGLWQNRRYPGIALALVGVVLNGVVITVNGGHMPIWEPSLRAAGLTPEDVGAFHVLFGPELDASFLVRLGPLTDVIPIPLPVVQNVASIGDIFLSAGLAFFLFASLIRRPDEAAMDDVLPLVGLAATARLPRSLDQLSDPRHVVPETGLVHGLAQAAALERPLVLAGPGTGLAEPALAPLPIGIPAPPTVAIPRPTPELVERARRNPYVRLALNGSFSALWTGQLISLFGDRVHQVALAFLVLQATESAIAVAFVFLSATLPNLLFGPVAGTLVDRWDQKEVMVVSDLLRASCVLLVPVAASIDILLVYPLVFLVTTISLFFRPARTAVLPRIVRKDDLLVANSATWLGETMADLIGYPLAGALVAVLGANLPLALWFDAGTYIASALLISTVAIPPVARSAPVGAGLSGVLDDLLVGWRFLRRETVLLANTLQGAAGQFMLGTLLAVAPIYARDQIVGTTASPTTVYGLLETAIGIGNLIGGLLVGFLAARLTKGRMVILGFAVQGLTVMALAMVNNLPLAFGLLAGGGVANIVYVIASQTLFQERTPADLIGRVVGFRFALVFGSLTLAMGLAGIGVEVFGLPIVIAASGMVAFIAGVAGWFVPAVRNA